VTENDLSVKERSEVELFDALAPQASTSVYLISYFRGRSLSGITYSIKFTGNCWTRGVEEPCLDNMITGHDSHE
jgi:hypothetical protein